MAHVRPITYYGTPVLHRRCAEVTVFDQALSDLIDDMFASMYAVKGVGLAANQIGVDARIFVYDCPDADDVRRKGHVINPVITALSDELDHGTEGCLSVPKPRASVPRSTSATVTGVDLAGKPITVTGTGYFARCLQHETDHLNGTLYVDLLPESQRDDLLRAAGLTPPAARERTPTPH
ncbi:peptide deformylase [Actinoplanes sichuanensis]|uniref:Peptide deformylase n=1 Tax=Actinoplanes sichuanensis TaxID=512349 RepID=A0ABW4ATA2_9ACTN|nr:peptide deformylase [Actinoplanes sichuanensis]BEL05223.1 peptide deformylase [Actinoplanes sichuanensis]